MKFLLLFFVGWWITLPIWNQPVFGPMKNWAECMTIAKVFEREYHGYVYCVSYSDLMIVFFNHDGANSLPLLAEMVPDGFPIGQSPYRTTDELRF
jgi:hypothetical protein